MEPWRLDSTGREKEPAHDGRTDFLLMSLRRCFFALLLLYGCSGGRRYGEGAHQEDELPALVFGEAVFERGHGLFAFADLIKDFAVGKAGVELAIAEIGGQRIVHGGFGAVAFAGCAMALRAVFHVQIAGGLQTCGRRLQRILALLGFVRDIPGALFASRQHDGERDQRQDCGEEDFAQ